MNAVELEWALYDGVITHISKVDRGKRCSCCCPHCKAPLVARKGEKNSHHFAHENREDCGHGPETALHLRAKAILANDQMLVLPSPYKNTLCLERLKIMDGKLAYQEVRVENKLGPIVPDVMLLSNGFRFVVEIYVTHQSTKEKISYLTSNDFPGIEIDLSDTDRNCSTSQLKYLVLRESTNRTWLHPEPPPKAIAPPIKTEKPTPVWMRPEYQESGTATLSSQVIDRLNRELQSGHKEERKLPPKPTPANNPNRKKMMGLEPSQCVSCVQWTTKWSSFDTKTGKCRCRECH